MPDPVSDPSQGRLDSWKEIAAYLKRDITTARRWEKREGMPVHRHLHEKLGSVYAFREELDAWTRSRHPRTGLNGSGEPAEAEPPIRRRAFLKAIAVVLPIAAAAGLWGYAVRSDYFWRDPLAGARFQNITDFAGTEQAAAISRDGRFVAFLSDRDGPIDVWVTQAGTGQFYNLTRGRFPELVNPSIRMLGFSPDDSLVTFWTRGTTASRPGAISIWAIPTLGGEPRPYFEGAAELDWSRDGSRLVYHTTDSGDPMFVTDGTLTRGTKPIFSAGQGAHAHFPTWAPDGAFVYFSEGAVLDAMDIWRIRPDGRTPQRLTTDRAGVADPVLLDSRTMMYLAQGAGGSGPWLYTMDVERRVPHRIGVGPERYTSLDASADGRRLVATVANAKTSLWRVAAAATPDDVSAPVQISVTTGGAFAPRLGPGYVLYASSNGASDELWKLAGGAATKLWSGQNARIVGGPEIAPDGRRVAFTAERRGQFLLYSINADGTDVRVLADSLDLRGSPAWTPDGTAVTSGADVRGTPHLFRIPLHGAPVEFVDQYAIDPAWSPAGDFLLFSGPDVGTTFRVSAVSAAAAPYPLQPLTLTRGARRLRVIDGGRALVLMRGDIDHKDIWLMDLNTGTQTRLTRLPADFKIRDFDISADGREVVLERVQETSVVTLIDRP